MYNLEFSIFRVCSGIEKKNNKKREKPFCVSEKKKRADAIREKRNRMTVSEASVDVTALCVNVCFHLCA